MRRHIEERTGRSLLPELCTEWLYARPDDMTLAATRRLAFFTSSVFSV